MRPPPSLTLPHKGGGNGRPAQLSPSDRCSTDSNLKQPGRDSWFVIASEAKQSIRPRGSKRGLLRSARNDVETHGGKGTRPRIPATQSAPESCPKIHRLEQQRAWGMPGARCTRSLACEKNKAHERSHREVHRRNPAFPHADGFNGFLRALLGDRAFLPPSPRELLRENLTPASGRQDHTTSPSALAPLVSAPLPASTASRAQRP
jgi:hypothetical protein